MKEMKIMSLTLELPMEKPEKMFNLKWLRRAIRNQKITHSQMNNKMEMEISNLQKKKAKKILRISQKKANSKRILKLHSKRDPNHMPRKSD